MSFLPPNKHRAKVAFATAAMGALGVATALSNTPGIAATAFAAATVFSWLFRKVGQKDIEFRRFTHNRKFSENDDSFGGLLFSFQDFKKGTQELSDKSHMVHPELLLSDESGNLAYMRHNTLVICSEKFKEHGTTSLEDVLSVTAHEMAHIKARDTFLYGYCFGLTSAMCTISLISPSLANTLATAGTLALFSYINHNKELSADTEGAKMSGSTKGAINVLSARINHGSGKASFFHPSDRSRIENLQSLDLDSPG